MTEDEMVGWHYPFHGHEFEQALGVGNGQGSLMCCSQWDCKELDTSVHLSTELNLKRNLALAPRLHYCFLTSPPLSRRPLLP